MPPTSPSRPIDKFAIALVATLAFGTYFAALLMFGHATLGSWAAVAAPIFASVVGICGVIALRRIERRFAAPRAVWPPALAGLPIVGILAGLPWASIDPTHRWLNAAVVGAVYGCLLAAYGWYRYRRPARNRAE